MVVREGREGQVFDGSGLDVIQWGVFATSTGSEHDTGTVTR